jgi:hypothetical protein
MNRIAASWECLGWIRPKVPFLVYPTMTRTTPQRTENYFENECLGGCIALRLGSMKVVPPGFLIEVAERPSTHLCAAKRYNPPKRYSVALGSLNLSSRTRNFSSSDGAACGRYPTNHNFFKSRIEDTIAGRSFVCDNGLIEMSVIDLLVCSSFFLSVDVCYHH